jgi:DNA helicase-2/ATP-dependent DNA helicase PcrA
LQRPAASTQGYTQHSGFAPRERAVPTQRAYNPAAERVTVTRPVAPRAAAAASILEAGVRVRHQTFGDGTVLSVQRMGADYLYEIAFDTKGTKKLMATYAKLQKI